MARGQLSQAQGWQAMLEMFELDFDRRVRDRKLANVVENHVDHAGSGRRVERRKELVESDHHVGGGEENGSKDRRVLVP